MDATRGLEYLHSQNIVHGDLKGVSSCVQLKVGSDPRGTKANVLIDSTYSARLADFGLTTIIDESTVGSATGGRGFKGTTRWMAPEILHPDNFEFSGEMQKQLPSKSTDIYALGMTILEVRIPQKALEILFTSMAGVDRNTAVRQHPKGLYCYA